MICAPSDSSDVLGNGLYSACVPTGMNTGVSTVWCGSAIRAASSAGCRFRDDFETSAHQMILSASQHDYLPPPSRTRNPKRATRGWPSVVLGVFDTSIVAVEQIFAGSEELNSFAEIVRPVRIELEEAVQQKRVRVVVKLAAAQCGSADSAVPSFGREGAQIERRHIVRHFRNPVAQVKRAARNRGVRVLVAAIERAATAAVRVRNRLRRRGFQSGQGSRAAAESATSLDWW